MFFQLPPGAGTFAGGVTSLMVMTDDNGIAVARGFQRGKLAGRFSIAVTASYQGQFANVFVTQTNKLAIIPKVEKWAIVGGAVVAAGLGLGFALRGSSATKISLGTGVVVPLR